MALPRKGARRIVVDGLTHRRRLRHRPTYAQALGWTPGTAAVEHADTPGSTLVVTTAPPHPGNHLGLPAAPIRPAEVAGAVRRALREGWIPVKPGSAFRLDALDDVPPTG
ncbi:hypothetical protein AB0L59_02935 [Streptomyces sp. NPDC052109]|uniref:hypothetical protein n=1 Tax=Streptomyces sp. NPDC052109 TaxID=3155527 RepID=UPI0034336E6C